MKSAGWEKRTAQELEMKEWKSMEPCVVYGSEVWGCGAEAEAGLFCCGCGVAAAEKGEVGGRRRGLERRERGVVKLLIAVRGRRDAMLSSGEGSEAG